MAFQQPQQSSTLTGTACTGAPCSSLTARVVAQDMYAQQPYRSCTIRGRLRTLAACAGASCSSKYA